MKRDFDYENRSIGYDWQFTEEDGGGIKCKNHIVCGAVLPKWWCDCKESYCTDCHICPNCHMFLDTFLSM